MKLLVISGAFPPMASGEAANTFHLCRRLAGAGVNVHVLTTRQPNIQEVDDVKVYPVMRRWSWREAGKLLQTIRSIAPDAILLMHLGGIYNNHPMITFAPTIAKRALPGVRFVTRFENPMFTVAEQPSLVRRVLRKAAVWWAKPERVSYRFGTLLRDSDSVIALCEYHLQHLRNEDSSVEANALLIPPPANLIIVPDADGALRTRGREELHALNDAFVIGYLGYLYPIKGVETLLRAAALLADRGLTIRLLIVGGSPDIAGVDTGKVSYYDEMRQLAGGLGLDRLTTWTGAFDSASAEIANYIHAADAFVLPFDNGIHLNNSSLATLASYGVPIVTTREHSDSALIDQQNVLLCPPRDADAIAVAIERLINEPELRAKLRSGAIALAHEYFDWETALHRTLHALRGAPVPETSAVDVSIVVATCNRAMSLCRLLDALVTIRSDGLRWDAWIIDNNSKDETATVVRSYAEKNFRIHYVFEGAQGKSHALNSGARHARGAVIAFTDDDCVPDEHWIARLHAAFKADEKLGLVGGRVDLLDPRDNPTATRTSEVRELVETPSDVFSLIIGCNMAMRRDLLYAVGEFDPQNCPGSSEEAVFEDIDFVYRAFRLGTRIEYRPEIRVYHNHGRRSDSELIEVRRRYARGRGSFFAKHIARGDRLALKLAYWEVRSTMLQLAKKLLSGKSAREEWRFISFLFAGAMTRFFKLNSSRDTIHARHAL